MKPSGSRRWLYRIALVLLIAVFLFAAYQVTVYSIHSHKAKQEEDRIRNIIAEADDKTSAQEACAAAAENTETPAATPIPAVSAMDAPPQPEPPRPLPEFQNALAINPDTVGKLKLGESIDTYVVQRDNAYYLRRSFSGEYSFSGAIFLDATCSIQPQSKVLILHGHNMKDGTAFGKLTRYKSINYLNQYPAICFSTLYETAQYLPFAVVYFSTNPKADNYLNIYQGNTLSDTEFPAFIQTVQSMSAYRIPVAMHKDEKVLVLTTCTADNSDMRFAIFAVKRSMI